MIKEIKMIMSESLITCRKMEVIFDKLASKFTDIQFKIESINNNNSAIRDLERINSYVLPVFIKKDVYGIEEAMHTTKPKELLNFINCTCKEGK